MDSTQKLPVVGDSMFVVATRLSNMGSEGFIDIVSTATYDAEMRFGAGAAAASTFMGVNVQLSSFVSRVPTRIKLSCYSKDKHNDAEKDDARLSELTMVVERQHKLSMGLGKAAADKKLNVSDVYVFVHHWLTGQLEFRKSRGNFHFDAHPDNVLVNLTATPMTFVWNDFGSTTSHVGAASDQFQRTIVTVKEFVNSYAPLNARAFQAILQEAADGAVKGEAIVVSSFKKALEWLESNRGLFNENAKRLAGQRMGQKLLDLELAVKELNTKNAQQDTIIAEQRAKIAQQDTIIAEQRAKIAQQDTII
eukprot:PhM_4_TR8350/c1_g1_i1/m.69579